MTSTRKRYTENEIILCAYIARFGRSFINEETISSLFDRPAGSVRMKVQNIARMLSEEGYRYSQEVSPWGGGHRTDWHIVQPYADLEEPDFTARVKKMLARGQHQSGASRERNHQPRPDMQDQRDFEPIRAELAAIKEDVAAVKAAIDNLGADIESLLNAPWDKISEETRTLFRELDNSVKSLGSVQTEEITTVSPRHVSKSEIHFKCTAAGVTPSVVASAHLLVRGGLDLHIHEKHLSAIPLEEGFTRPYHNGCRKIMIRDREHIRRAEPLLRAAYDDLHKHRHARAKDGALKPPVTRRRPGDLPTDRRIPPNQRGRRRMGDRDYLQLGENHEP